MNKKIIIIFLFLVIVGMGIGIGYYYYFSEDIPSSKLEVGKTYEVKVNGSSYTSITLSNTINTFGSGNGVNDMGRNSGRGRW